MKVFLLYDYPNLTAGQEYDCLYMDDINCYIVNEIDSNVRTVRTKHCELTDDRAVTVFKMCRTYESGYKSIISDVIYYNDKIIITKSSLYERVTFNYHRMDEHVPDYTESNINLLDII